MGEIDRPSSSRSQQIKDLIDRPEYQDSADLPLTSDDAVWLLLYVMSIEKSQRLVSEAVAELDASGQAGSALKKLVAAGQVSEKISQAIIDRLRRKVEQAGTSHDG